MTARTPKASTPQLLITPRKNALVEGEDAVVEALVRLQAPPAPAPEPEAAPTRPPLDLAIVIDRSGSMSGHPLSEAKRCAAMIVDRLSPDDRIGVVDFGSDVAVTWASAPVTDREAVKAAIASIACDGMTALHGGWLKGAEMIAPRVAAGSISRVLLLSDGGANVGLSRSEEIAPQAAQLAAAGVSTSTYGLGAGFDERLMAELATAGGGRAYYGKTADDLMEPFEEEFDLMSATCARDVRLSISPSAGVIVEALNEYPRDGAAWRLPDLAFEGEVWMLVRATIAEEHVRALDGGVIFEATVKAADLDRRPLPIEPARLILEARPAAAVAALAEDAIVARRVGEIEAARIQREAREAAERNDWAAVDARLVECRALAADNAYIAGGLPSLEALARRRDRARFSKEAYFKAMKMRSRMASHVEAAEFDPDAELSRPAYVRRKPEEGAAFRPRPGAETGDGEEPTRPGAIGDMSEEELLRALQGDAGDAPAPDARPAGPREEIRREIEARIREGRRRGERKAG